MALEGSDAHTSYCHTHTRTRTQCTMTKRPEAWATQIHRNTEVHTAVRLWLCEWDHTGRGVGAFVRCSVGGTYTELSRRSLGRETRASLGLALRHYYVQKYTLYIYLVKSCITTN